MHVEAGGARDAFAVTASDDTKIAADALYIGVGGSVVIETHRGTSVPFANVLSGSILPVKCTKVKAATSATDIIGLQF